MSSLTVTYTPVYTNSEPWRFQWVSDNELEALEVAPQSPGQAPPSLDYVPGPEHPPSPDYVLGPEEPEQAPLSLDYVPEPEYPEYLVPSDADAPNEDQPLPDDASPTTLSPGYVTNSDPEEDSKEDPTDYPADEGDDDDDESSNDDDDDDNEEQEASKDTEAFETDESAHTPVPSPRCRRARISVRPQTPMLAATEALIAAIPSPPLPLPSPPTHTSRIYAEAPLGYRAARIWLRVASLSTYHPSEIPLLPLFEVGESSPAAAARQVQETHELQMRCEDAHDNQALLRAQLTGFRELMRMHVRLIGPQMDQLMLNLKQMEPVEMVMTAMIRELVAEGQRELLASALTSGIKKIEIKLWNWKAIKESNEVKKYVGGLPVYLTVKLKQKEIDDTFKGISITNVTFQKAYVARALYLLGTGKEYVRVLKPPCPLMQMSIMMGSVLPSAPTVRGLAIWPGTVGVQLLLPTTKETSGQIKGVSLAMNVGFRSITRRIARSYKTRIREIKLGMVMLWQGLVL
ncbi:hypothetical protein Tco_0348205 [Tanacetum coccineum]